MRFFVCQRSHKLHQELQAHFTILQNPSVENQLPAPRKPAKVSPNISQNLSKKGCCSAHKLCSALPAIQNCMGKRCITCRCCIPYTNKTSDISTMLVTLGFLGHVFHAKLCAVQGCLLKNVFWKPEDHRHLLIAPAQPRQASSKKRLPSNGHWNG